MGTLDSTPPKLAAWPEAEDGVQQEANGHMNGKSTPQWNIKTDSERYIDSLEKRLHASKESKRKGQKDLAKSSNGTAHHNGGPGALDADIGYHSDPDQLEGGGETDDLGTGDRAEDDVVDDSENACLLYKPTPPAGHAEPEDKDKIPRDEADISRPSYYDGNRGRRASAPLPRHHNGILASENDEESPGPGDTSHIRYLDASSVLPANIRFSDTVRICGGVRSSSAAHHHDIGPEALGVRRSLSVSSTSRGNLLPQNASPSYSQHGGGSILSSGPNSANNSAISIQSPIPVASPHARFPLPTTFSRPASFISDEGLMSGRSRASTPASLYAPLLGDSKSAPSPSRRFYLTFKRDDGSVSYRELVERQKQRKLSKKSKKNRREKRRSRGDDLESSQPVTRDRSCLSWSSLAFWQRGYSEDEEDLEPGRRRGSTGSISSQEYEDDGYGDQDRLAYKSEVQVLFGSAPWRFFKLNFWRYKFSRLSCCGSDGRYEEV